MPTTLRSSYSTSMFGKYIYNDDNEAEGLIDISLKMRMYFCHGKGYSMYIAARS